LTDDHKEEIIALAPQHSPSPFNGLQRLHKLASHNFN